MGQETGLTALCTLAMFSFIEQARDQPTRRWLIWAGLAAGTGALAREYGLALIPLGALALVWWRTPRRGWLQFCLTAAAVALPWYLRNWLKTGHPLYSLGTGELFPANPIHLEYMRIVAAEKSIGGQLSSAVPLLAKLVALVAGVPFVFGCVTGFARWRSFLPWLAAAAAFGALWLGSIAHTSGGYTYSTRFLTPAIALMAVVGGVGIAGWATSRRSWLVVAGMTVLALDAAGRSLFLPANVQASWWREPSLVWHRRENKIERSRENINWAAIADAALLIGVDTGLTHIGSALAVPTVALFGSTCPYLDPVAHRSVVLYEKLACSPCRRNPTCDGRFDCMRALEVERVMSEALRVCALPK
jgi:4-amino-4-deoxy-L-arabinose transferase-like glycosyltransferase